MATPTPAVRDLSIIDDLEKKITRPLTQRPAIRAYWEQIMDARSKLWRGLIRDVHEFELALISRNTVITSEPDENLPLLKVDRVPKLLPTSTADT